MKKILIISAALLLCACTGREIDRSKVVTNPIDLDYEFTKGDGQGTSTSNVDLNDPNLINSVPEEYKETVAQLLKVPGALQSLIERMAAPNNYRSYQRPWKCGR